MSIIRVNKTKNYTVLSNHHFKEKAMSLKAKGLLSLMLSLPDDWNYSIAGLVSLSKDGKDSVMGALAELEKFGYLNRLRTTNSKGQFSGVEYNIYEEPQKDIPVAEKQNEDKQNAEEANAEKQSLLNTNQLKTKFNKITKELNTNEIAPEMEVLLFRLVSNDEIKELYKDYIRMRKDIGAPLTPRGLEMLIHRCERLSGMSMRKQKLLLETAIINNWKNIYHPKGDEVKEEVMRELKDFYDRE
jgi:hypothetical protein